MPDPQERQPGQRREPGHDWPEVGAARVAVHAGPSERFTQDEPGSFGPGATWRSSPTPAHPSFSSPTWRSYPSVALR